MLQKNKLLLLILAASLTLGVQHATAIEVPNDSPGIAAVWHFNSDAQDGNLYDSSINSLPVRCYDANCPAFVSGGKYGGAFQFNGKSTYMFAPNRQAINPREEITIFLWVKAEDLSGKKIIFQKGDEDNQYRLFIENGSLKFELKGVLGGLIEGPLPKENFWQNITVTFDSEFLRLYVGGILVNQQTTTGRISVAADPLYIGAKNELTPAKEHFKGQIDEFAIWNRALTSEEIFELVESTPICGDNVCAEPENCISCSQDCGVCEIAGCYDINSDGSVNILDMAYVARSLGASNPYADVDSDGIIDITDLILVSQGIGGSCNNQ